MPRIIINGRLNWLIFICATAPLIGLIVFDFFWRTTAISIETLITYKLLIAIALTLTGIGARVAYKKHKNSKQTINR